MNRGAPLARRRAVLLVSAGLTVSLISPLGDALVTDATAGTLPAGAAPASVVTSTAALAAASTPSPAHPYSDPIWSPLRTPANVSCVLSNCPGPYHGLWAIDFIGKDKTKYDPLYAAGAGVFHIGAISRAAPCSGATTQGTWVWVDHGGGRTTRYSHLNEVSSLLKDGDLVTPATKIGTMGHSGHCPNVNYLHMEYRAGGNTGTRVAPRSMRACAPSGRVTMPASLGYATWNAVRMDPKLGYLRGPLTPAATNSCLPTSWTSTPARPAVTGRRGPASATIGWGVVPASVGHTIVTIEQWHPSLKRYGKPVYRTVTRPTSSTRFTRLLNGRTYRLRATTHNSAGYSAWSPYVRVVPAAAPSAPRAPRALSTTTSSIRYAWWLPAANGAPITKFVVARRCVVRGAWTRWVGTNVAARVRSSYNLHYNWTRMPRGRTCQVRVKAVNSAGYGRWSVTRRATTLR